MLKKIMYVAALSVCINSAHAGWMQDNWFMTVEEDPMTDEKSVQMRSFTPEFTITYSCKDNKDKTRSFSFLPIGRLMYLFGTNPEGKSTVSAKIRIDKGKIYEIYLERYGNILFFLSKSLRPDQEQKFAEVEKDFLQSTRRVVLELDDIAYVIPSGDARVAAKTVIDVCGALSPPS